MSYRGWQGTAGLWRGQLPSRQVHLISWGWAPRCPEEGPLDQPVLQGVEGDHRQAATRGECCNRIRQRPLQRVQLIVHGNAQRLHVSHAFLQ